MTIVGKRPTNEDAHSIFSCISRGQKYIAAAVFDGHAGDEAAIFCGQNFQ